METLPIEIVNHVMRFLPLEDLHSCSLVCKKWYMALKDPSINSRLVCRVDLQNDAKEVTEVAKFVRSRLISHLTISDSCPRTRSCEETMFWMDKDNMFEMIKTLYLDESVDHERVKILMSINTNFINVKVVEMCSSFLIEALFVDIANREKVMCALQKIPQLHLIVEDQFYYNILKLLNMKLNFSSLLFKKIFEISKNHRNELVTTIKSGPNEETEKSLPLHDLIAFCSQHQCTLHFQFLYVFLPEFKLSKVVAVLRSFPKLNIEFFNVRHNLTSITEEDSSYLEQISNFGLNHLVLRSTSYVHNWLSKGFLSSATLGCESLTRIQCLGKLDKVTLGKIFSYCPFAECVSFDYTYNTYFGESKAKCRDITVKYRTALNSHLKEFRLYREFPNPSDLTYLDLLSAVPLHLREFSMTIYSQTSDPTVLMKLNERCPNIKKLTIIFQAENIHHNFLGEMGKLEELVLIYCVKNVMENMSIPCLKMLTLKFKDVIKDNTVFEIVRAFRGIKNLNLQYCNQGCPQNVQGCPKNSLKEGLSVLTELEELKLTLRGYVDGETFEALSFFTPPLNSLTLFKRKDDDFSKQLREFQNMHPNVKVTFFIDHVGNKINIKNST